MKFTEFLLERISISHYNKIIENGLLDCANQLIDMIPSFKKKISIDNKNQAREGILQPLVAELYELMRPGISSIFRLGMSRTINNSIPEVDKKVNILFKDLGEDDGLTEGYNITINIKYITDLLKILLRLVANISHSSEDQLATFFSASSETINKKFAITNIPAIQEMVPVFVHELVHVIQNVKQSHRNGTTEYRSYLTKDNERFQGAVTKGAHGPDAHLYYSSPQEIAAFSHDIALQIIPRLRGKQLNRVDIQNAVREKIGEYFPDLSNRKIQKVYNRYLKLVYQEVVDNLNK